MFKYSASRFLEKVNVCMKDILGDRRAIVPLLLNQSGSMTPVIRLFRRASPGKRPSDRHLIRFCMFTRADL